VVGWLVEKEEDIGGFGELLLFGFGSSGCMKEDLFVTMSFSYF